MIDILNPKACKFCLAGAINRVTRTHRIEPIPFLNAVRNHLPHGFRSIAQFNDNSEHDLDDILHVLYLTKKDVINMSGSWQSYEPLGQ